ADRFDHVLAHLPATLHPGPAAEADADVGARGDLERPRVAVEVAEDRARDAGQLGHGRVVRVDSDPDAGLLGDGHDLADEIVVVLPELFLGELAAVTQRRLEHLAGPVPLGRLQPERARRRAASGRLALGAPDAVPHVRVGRVVDPGSGEVAQVLLVLLDL